MALKALSRIQSVSRSAKSSPPAPVQKRTQAAVAVVGEAHASLISCFIDGALHRVHGEGEERLKAGSQEAKNYLTGLSGLDI